MLLGLLKRLFAFRGKTPDAGHFLKLAEVELAAKRYASAATRFDQAWNLLPGGDPRRAATALRMARSLKFDNDLDAADSWFRRVLEIEPGNTEALELLAFLHYSQSQPDSAREVMRRRIAVRPAPGLALRKALMGLPVICDSTGEIDEVRLRYGQALDELLDTSPEPLTDPVVEIGLTPFYLAYHGRNDRQLMEKLAQACRRSYRVEIRKDFGRRANGTKIRIGFVSTHFNNHTIARTTLGHIRDLPRDRFEVLVFAVAPGEDDMSRRIRANCDAFYDLPMDLKTLRLAIAEARLDVLFFADIGMHPLTYYLAYSRLAPIQISAWGHPVTSGLETIDYFVSAQAVEAEDADEHYSESLWRLPAFFQCGYTRPVLTGPKLSRDELGLPQGHLYACLQSEFKLHPDFDAALRSILERDPQGRVLFLRPNEPGRLRRIEQRFERTLGKVAERVHFLPRMVSAQFLHVIANADVMLDPFHFGGNMSTAEALALDVPAVTLPSRFARARFTTAMCREIGLDECIASDADDYAKRAVRLACDGDFRESLVLKIVERSDRLFGRNDITLALAEKLEETFESRSSLPGNA